MKTILITGCSTGFGREIAAYFLTKGWNVVATMRDPSANTLPPSERLRVLALDVTNAESIAAAVKEAGVIDVLVNNAGVGWLGVVEGTSIETVRRVFETNTFSTITMMQAVLPGMRERKAGVIVNVSSCTTYKSLPLLSLYRSSKAAMNAITECSALELEEFGIRVRAVLPGRAPTTNFSKSFREKVASSGGFPDAYADFIQKKMAETNQRALGSDVTTPEDVSEAVFRAVTDPDCPILLPAGADAIAWSEGR